MIQSKKKEKIMKKEEFLNLDIVPYYAKIILFQGDDIKAELIVRDLDELENSVFQVLRSGYDIKIEIHPDLKKKYKSYDLIP